MVIVLTETQRSMTDVCDISLSNASKLGGSGPAQPRPTTSRCLSSAVGPMDSTMDNDSESQRSRALQGQDLQEHGLEKAILEVREE